MRVGIIALLHESNTFIAEPTSFEHFCQDVLLTGEAIRERLAETHHEVAGFFEGLERAGIEAVPVFAARAMPYGVIARDAFQRLVAMMLDELRQAGSLNGLLAAPHGAAVSEEHRDADGYWLSAVRGVLGSHAPIMGTLDAHANLSPRMVESCDALISYRTNPHLDQRARGVEAATLIARTLRGEVRPRMAAACPPMAISIESQETAAPPCRPVYQFADEILGRPGVLSNSVLLGFPYADVQEMGSSAIVVADNSAAMASELANAIAQEMWSRRDELIGELISIDQAVDRAAKLDGPICLLDMGDNVGGGSPGDSTHLAHAIRRRIGSAFVCLYDPEGVKQAAKAGKGSRALLRVGGKTDNLHGEPLEDEFRVLGLYDGAFEEPEPRHGGLRHFDQGKTAVIQTDLGLTIMLTSRRMPPFSLRQLTSCGLDPTLFHVLVAKGVNAPVAAYQPVCKHLIRVNTPGCTTADMTTLDFQHRRRPMFPFERGAQWEAGCRL